MTRGLRSKMAVLLWVGLLGCARAPIVEDRTWLVEWPSHTLPIDEEEEEAEQVTPVAAATPVEPLPGPPRASNFLVLGGGDSPERNEIALEKNVHYFQRTLERLGLSPASASVYFANGNDGQATVRYLENGTREQFKVPEIPHLKGPATLERFLEWVEHSAQQSPQRPVFIYFTGHGGLNRGHLNNNNLALWEGDTLTVRAFGLFLGRLPKTTPVVTVMAQCYAGSFAHFIHQDGNPLRPVVDQPRCGFFATVEYLPSVGCTPEVNEADYHDYSSSFFAGLSGMDRTGKAVDSADYDGDGRVSYAEAHAFAKVDARTPDLPISTAEAWLQRRASRKDRRALLEAPILEVLSTARPEQRHVVESLARELGFLLALSWSQNAETARLVTDVDWARSVRLRMELLNIGMREKLRASGSAPEASVLERLLQCEGGSWDVPPRAAPAL